MFAGDPRQASAQSKRRAPPSGRKAAGAQPEARLCSRTDRKACCRAVPRIVRSRDEAGLGLLGQSGCLVRSRLGRDTSAAISACRYACPAALNQWGICTAYSPKTSQTRRYTIFKSAKLLKSLALPRGLEPLFSP